MSQSTDNQHILSRSAKILFVGFAQYFIMGFIMATIASSIMDVVDSPESADLDMMNLISSIDMWIYYLISFIFLLAGTITFIVSGIVYLVDKRKGIKFIAPKNEPVSIKRQTIYALIPLLDMYAAIKVRKFWLYFLIIMGVSAITIPLDELEIIPQTFPESLIINEAILLPIAVVIIRMFSKKWNKQFSEDKTNDELK